MSTSSHKTEKSDTICRKKIALDILIFYNFPPEWPQKQEVFYKSMNEIYSRLINCETSPKVGAQKR